jgi:hypothetical protein
MAVVAQDAVPRDQARTRMKARVSSLAKARQSQEPVLRDIQRYIAPYRGRFQSETQEQRGKRKDQSIINNTAGRSMNILASGLMAGLTSPGRPWFRLTTHDPDLAEFGPVRAWLDDVARAMRAVFGKSNLYNVLPGIYGELGAFGTAALLEVRDPNSLVRFFPYTIGTYSIAQDDRLVVDTFSREYKATIGQLVARFGTDKLSAASLQKWRQGKVDLEVDCVHLIEPNRAQNRNGLGPISMPFVEDYWEAASDKIEPLHHSGYEERALFVPRWDVTGDDLWGKGIGHDILGDVKQLQFLERRKEDVIEKQTDPPLEASMELRGKRLSLLAGDVNYTNPQQAGGAQIKPIVQVHPSAYQYVAQDIQELMMRIKQAAFEDMFLMLANDTRSNITAREVEERHQEKMLILGPVLERLNEELFDPMIDRTFAIMQRMSEGVWRGVLSGKPVLPPPPQEMQEQELRVEYTSILAQAAKATSTQGIETFGMFAGQMAQLFGPSLLDKIDGDQMIDEYADARGVPARIIRDDDTVADIRSKRDQQNQMQQLAAAAPALKDGAAAIKDMASAVPLEGSVLQNMAQAQAQP